MRQPIDKTLTPLQNIFKNRGMPCDKDSIRHYINPTVDDVISLDKIEHLKEGAQMLMRHIQANDKVMLVVDEDCDGYTSSAFFLN